MSQYWAVIEMTDVDSGNESAWLNSDGLEFDRFTWSLLTVTVGAIGIVTLQEVVKHNKKKVHDEGQNIWHSEYELQSLASVAEPVESSIVAR